MPNTSLVEGDERCRVEIVRAGLFFDFKTPLAFKTPRLLCALTVRLQVPAIRWTSATILLTAESTLSLLITLLKDLLLLWALKATTLDGFLAYSRSSEVFGVRCSGLWGALDCGDAPLP